MRRRSITPTQRRLEKKAQQERIEQRIKEYKKQQEEKNGS